MLQLAKMMADMQDYDVQFFHQSSARAMAVPPVDIIIGNLPVDGKVEAADKDSELAQAGCNFLPYLLVENHLNYLASGGYAIYVIGNDFFSQEYAAKFHEILTATAEIGMLLQLPTNLFKDSSQQKSIFVVRKHGEGLSKVQEVLVGNFPDFGNIDEFRAMLTKVEKWVKMNKW
jgi:site-specific DNA-methyltransferase (adenine-specific)